MRRAGLELENIAGDYCRGDRAVSCVKKKRSKGVGRGEGINPYLPPHLPSQGNCVSLEWGLWIIDLHSPSTLYVLIFNCFMISTITLNSPANTDLVTNIVP